MDVDSDLEQLMSHIGDFGTYQLQQSLLHMLTLVTVAAVPDHRCEVPGVDENGTVALWDSPEVLASIPLIRDGVLDSCHLIDPTTNSSVKCNKWVYDNTYYQSSRVIEWNLVCDKRWMGAVAQSAYMFDVFTGAVVLGSMADKYVVYQ